MDMFCDIEKNNRNGYRRLLILSDCALLGNVDTIQEFSDIFVPYPTHSLDGRSLMTVSPNAVWSNMLCLPDCETFWTSEPSRINSSFCDLDSLTVTPSSMLTCRTIYAKYQVNVFKEKFLGNNYLLSQKVSNLQGSSAILDDAVDGEVSVYCAHLVLETLGDDDLSESQE